MKIRALRALIRHLHQPKRQVAGRRVVKQFRGPLQQTDGSGNLSRRRAPHPPGTTRQSHGPGCTRWGSCYPTGTAGGSTLN